MRREHSRSSHQRAARLAIIGGAVLSLSTTAYAVSPCSPAPCSVDGNCVPNRLNWGVYGTHWRTWPGDNAHPSPTPAGGDDATKDKQLLDGIVLPDPSKEGKSGSEKQAEPGAPALPGEEAAPAEEPAAEADPFSMRRQIPMAPIALQQPAAQDVVLTPPAANFGTPVPAYVQPLPEVIESPASITPAAATSPANGHQDDAPPALPESLQGLVRPQGAQPVAVSRPYGKPLSAVRPQAAAAVGTAPATSDPAPQLPASLAQPQRVLPSATAVRPVSWETPGGIALVNPAAAVDVQPGADGAKQAIYYEATPAEASASDAQ